MHGGQFQAPFFTRMHSQTHVRKPYVLAAVCTYISVNSVYFAHPISFSNRRLPIEGHKSHCYLLFLFEGKEEEDDFFTLAQAPIKKRGRTDGGGIENGGPMK